VEEAIVLLKYPKSSLEEKAIGPYFRKELRNNYLTCFQNYITYILSEKREREREIISTS